MDHDEARENGPDATADADLVVRTRSGDTGAYGELWLRHYRAGVTVARNMTSSLDADDLVQEAYTRIYHSIVTGGGPTGSFRAYLFTSIRNTAAAWGRARRETAYEELEAVEDPASEDHQSEAALDRSLTHEAFRSLPPRWQEVLWYSEIERMKPAEIAPLLGIKATAVAQLTFRAREGLREAWVQAHLRSLADGSDCQWAIAHLGAYARENLGPRDRAKVERHLNSCVRCSIVAGEAKEVSSRLALVLLPLAVGTSASAAYLAAVHGGGAPIAALASMPSSVAPGAASSAVGAGSVGGVGAAATGAGTAAAVGTTAVTTAGAAAESALAGIGASGIASAGLVVVTGVVAAAVALPAGAPVSAPTPTPSIVTTDVAPAPVASALDQEDRTSHLPAESGPDPADLLLVPDTVAADAARADDDDANGSGQKDASVEHGVTAAADDSGSASDAEAPRGNTGDKTIGSGGGNGAAAVAAGAGTPTGAGIRSSAGNGSETGAANRSTAGRDGNAPASAGSTSGNEADRPAQAAPRATVPLSAPPPATPVPPAAGSPAAPAAVAQPAAARAATPTIAPRAAPPPAAAVAATPVAPVVQNAGSAALDNASGSNASAPSGSGG